MDFNIDYFIPKPVEFDKLTIFVCVLIALILIALILPVPHFPDYKRPYLGRKGVHNRGFELFEDARDEVGAQFNSRNAVLDEYYIIFLCVLTALILTALILLASYFLAYQKPYAEKKTAYECGFEPFEDARGKADIQFCVLAILFVVFDIEILFLMPWCFSLPSLQLLDFWVGCEFLLELGIGLFYVWAKKLLDW